MVEKIKILFVSDWGPTGFGTVGSELCARLADMEVFDVHYLGWHAKPHHIEQAKANGITLHLTHFWEPRDQFGNFTFPETVKKVQPHVVISLGDPWMIEHIANDPSRHNYQWLAYVPIDRDVIRKSWIDIMKKPDCLVLFSQFGMDVVNDQIPFRNPRLILHGVDKMVFKPYYPEGTDENTPHAELMAARKAQTLGPQFKDKFVVGWVGRNQVRKNMPRTIRAFKAFNCATWIEGREVQIENGDRVESIDAPSFCRNKQCFRCDVCPAFEQREETSDTILYLHTSRGETDNNDMPGIGWLVDELVDRHNLHDRIAMTPNITALNSLPRGALAQVMNTFDVHCFLTYSEGFGLPIAESISCGVPTLATDYSSMTELLSDGGGMLIRPVDFVTYVTYENEMASADIGDAAMAIDEIFSDEENAIQMRKDAANSSYVPDWNMVAMQFRELVFEAVGRG